MQSGYPKHRCYADSSHRSFGEFIKLNNASALHLALLVSDFARQMAAVYEQFAKDIQTIIAAFKSKYNNLKTDRPTDTPSTIMSAWECLLHGTENDAQAHMDVAVLLMKNVHKPLEEVAIHKKNQTHKLNSYRDQFEEAVDKVEHDLQVAEENYQGSVKAYQNSSSHNAKLQFLSAHNEYLCQLCASNRTIEEFHYLIPQVLEELEEIYIDTSNTVNIAMESHALMLLTKADEQHHRFKEMLRVCRQVNPQLDISHFMNAINTEPTKIKLCTHTFRPADINIYNNEMVTVNHLILEAHTEHAIQERRQTLQKDAAVLTSYIKHNQENIHTLMMICQRDRMMSVTEAELSMRPAEHRNGETYKGSLLHSEGSVSRQNSAEEDLKIRRQMHKQESKDSGIVTEMSTRPKDYGRSKTEKIHRSDSSKVKSRKSDSFKSSVKRSQSMKTPNSGRNFSQSSNRSTGNLKDLDSDNQIEVLSPKQNGSMENIDQDSKKSSATIKSMWKKAFKNLKSTSDTKLTKKGSLIKKKQNSQEAEVEENIESGEIDPVYSLLKCAADLPKATKPPSCGLHPQCSGHHSNSTKGDSSTSTSKTTSPASSGTPDVSHSLGSDFKTYYKQTSPAIKKQTSSPFIIPF